jgi:hypothetical protein
LTAVGSLLPPELETRLQALSRRPWISSWVSDWITGDNRFFLLSGGPGTGKTMMAALILAERNEGASDTWAASYFCSSRLMGFSRHPRHFVSRIQECLLARHPEAYLKQVQGSRPLIDVAATISADSISGTATGIKIAVGQLTASSLSVGDYFQTAIIEPLEVIASTDPDTRIGILIDGLDDALLHDGFGIPALLNEYAASFPRNCKVLLTSQNDPSVLDPLLRAVRDIVHLDLSETRNRTAVSKDLRDYAQKAITQSDVTSPGEVAGVSAQIAQAAQGNFLHAESLVRELLSGTSAEGDLLAPTDLPGYYLDLFNRLEKLLGAEQPPGISWRNDCLPLLYLLAATQAPVPYPNLIQLLESSEAAISTAVRAVRTLLQVNSEDQVTLEHQYVGQLLFAPTLPDHRPNRHATDEVGVQERVLRRIAHLVNEEWHGSWLRADPYTASHLAGYMARLQSLAPTEMDSYSGELRLPGLVRRLAEGPETADNPTGAMGTLLRVLRNMKPAPDSFMSAVVVCGRSGNPYVRASAVDVIQECTREAPALALAAVSALLQQDNLNSWLTAAAAMMSLEPAARNEIIRWIATKGSAELRRHFGNVLYLLVGGDAKVLAAEMLYAVTNEISLTRPNRSARAIDFVANVSIAGYINNCDDPEVAEMTSALWKHMTVSRLHLNIINRRLMERPIVSVAAKQLAERVVDVFSEQLAATEAERALISRLLPGLVPHADISSLLEPLRDGFASGRWTPRAMSACVVAVQATCDHTGCSGYLDELFEASPGEGRIWQIATFTVLIRATPPEWASRLEAMISRVLAENRESLDSYFERVEDPQFDLLFASLPLALAKHRMPVSRVLWNALDEADARVRRSAFCGIAVVGLYYPSFVLAILRRILDVMDVEAVQADLAQTLSRMAFMHRDQVDVFVRETGLAINLSPTTDAADVDFVRRYIDGLGLYNNAVHQSIYYPMMRNGLLVPGFTGLAECQDAPEFVRYYAPKVLRLFRDAHYELLRWTERRT